MSCCTVAPTLLNPPEKSNKHFHATVQSRHLLRKLLGVVAIVFVEMSAHLCCKGEPGWYRESNGCHFLTQAGWKKNCANDESTPYGSHVLSLRASIWQSTGETGWRPKLPQGWHPCPQGGFSSLLGHQPVKFARTSKCCMHGA